MPFLSPSCRLFRLILLSVRHFWKMNVAVACGVAVGTAVLTGARIAGARQLDTGALH